MRSETGIKDLLLGNLKFEIRIFWAKTFVRFYLNESSSCVT